MSQRASPGFFGPHEGAVASVSPAIVRALSRRRRVNLPRQLGDDMARTAAAARKARDGDARAALGDLEWALLRRATLGPTLGERERIEAIGYDAWLEEQLEIETLDDSALEDALHEALPTLSLRVGEIWRDYQTNPFVPVFELWTATLYRAIYSPRQLYERMVVFWSDHFSIDIQADMQWLLKPVDDRDVVRAHALGNFGDMLSASAHSPAMLIYLTNDTNQKNFPNENYARELMELHTLGADNGYTEQDVKEVARCFTGWKYEDPYSPLGEPGAFRFSSTVHDTESKRVLGRNVPADGGIEDGERILTILANHRNTAEFISAKMLRYLWGYEPDRSSVRAVTRAYRRSDGNIRQMVRAALKTSRVARAPAKLKRPFHLYVSVLRALGADLQEPGFVLESLLRAGHIPFGWIPPDGYPDDPVFWSGFILPRWNFTAMFLGPEAGIGVEPAIDDPAGAVTDIVERIDRLLLDGRMRAETRAELDTFLRDGRKTRKRVREAIGLAAASPEFQEY